MNELLMSSKKSWPSRGVSPTGFRDAGWVGWLIFALDGLTDFKIFNSIQGETASLI
jgi:hypothetical protein